MKKVLILATDLAITEILKENLSYFNFDVKALNNPDQLVAAITEYKPDLLLMDFFLQDANGGSICHQLKCDPETHKLPIIILSEYPELITFSRKFGCDAAVPKPVDLPALLAKINGLAGKDHEQVFTTAKSPIRVSHKSSIFQH
jgi:CheY-like chemotaxis protein